MTDTKESLSEQLPWWRLRLSLLWGIGALITFVFGLYVGTFWSPLFWLFAIMAFILFLVARDNAPAPMNNTLAEQVIVAPVEGVISEIVTDIDPPRELKLEGDDWHLIRIASAPWATSGLRAPVSGGILGIVQHGGQASALAIDPDEEGLAAAYIRLSTKTDQLLGLRLVTGGLGPRLKVSAKSGSDIEAGKRIGFKRLGGWCDLYVDRQLALEIRLQQRLIAGETIIAKMAPDKAVGAQTSYPEEQADPQETSVSPGPVPTHDSSPEAKNLPETASSKSDLQAGHKSGLTSATQSTNFGAQTKSFSITGR